MPTLILTPRYTDDTQTLWKAAASLGWQVERLTSWRVPTELRALPEPVLYAEALFGPTIAAVLGIDLLSPAEDWLVRLPFAYRKRAISLSTLGQARQLAAPAFVKPPNDKSFPAAVYSGAGLPTEYDDDMPVLVSDIVTWEKEFRCFILDRTLRTFSIYARAGELQRDADFHSTPEEDAQLHEFIGRLLADPAVDLPAATVVDVGTISGLGWACVEQNAASGAGIYGCDPVQVLAVLQRASIKQCDTREPMKIRHFDPSRLPGLTLKLRRVNKDDLSLFSKYDLKDWNDEEFNLDMELKLGEWVSNEDRKVILLPLGGGAFEIPEMYELIVDETKVRIWCGGGGDQARSYRKNADQINELTIFVSEIWIPSVLSHKQDAVLESVVDAFAALYAYPGPLTVEFKLISVA